MLYSRGAQHTARGPDPARVIISSSPRKHALRILHFVLCNIYHEIVFMVYVTKCKSLSACLRGRMKLLFLVGHISVHVAHQNIEEVNVARN